MKKAYLRPKTKIHRLRPTRVICTSSNGSFGFSTETGQGGEDEATKDRDGIWDSSDDQGGGIW